MFPAISHSPPLKPIWTKVSGGESLAVDLATVKAFTNRALEDDTWDDELQRFVRVAQLAIEDEIKGVLSPTVWRGTLPSFFNTLHLVRRPFVAVNKIEYVDTDGEIRLLPTDYYQWLPGPQMCGYLARSDELQWPRTARRLDAVRIEVASGFSTTEEETESGYPALPDDILHAVLMTVASMDNARGDIAASSDTTVYAMKAAAGAGAVPREAKSILAQYKYVWVTV